MIFVNRNSGGTNQESGGGCEILYANAGVYSQVVLDKPGKVAIITGNLGAMSSNALILTPGTSGEFGGASADRPYSFSSDGMTLTMPNVWPSGVVILG